MSERTQELSQEEVMERVRARKSRAKWGAFYALAGFVFAVVAMWELQALGFATLGMGVSMVGAGFVQPADIKGLWGK